MNFNFWNRSKKDRYIKIIDIHSHILAGVDDGSRNWEESVRMAKNAEQQGVTDIIATPHYRLTAPPFSFDELTEKISFFQDMINKNNIPIKIHRGIELEMEMEITDFIDRKVEEIFLAGSKRYILVHFPLSIIPVYIKEFIFKITSRGVIPILAHPERNEDISEKLNLIKELVRMGAKIQLSAGSLVGYYDQQAKKNAESYLKNGLVSFIASDAHSDKAKLFNQALDKAESICENIEKLVGGNPAEVLKKTEKNNL